MKRVTCLPMLFVLGVAVLFFSGCAGTAAKYTPANAPEKFACAAENNVEKILAPQATLEDFSCSYKKWEGKETLHFNVAVKNAASTPQRYRVHIFLDNGKAVGGLIPSKTAGGLIEPGQVGSDVYPVNNMALTPKTVTIKISTVEP